MRRSITVLSLVVLGTGLFCAGYFTHTRNKTPASVSSRPVDVTAVGVFNAVNDYRVQQGQKPLYLDTKLTRAAELKCQDMLDKGYYGHENPQGKHGYDFIDDQYPDVKIAGENLNMSINFTKSTQFVDDKLGGWIASESHRLAIVDPKYHQTGVAVCGTYDKQYANTYAVQMFANLDSL